VGNFRSSPFKDNCVLNKSVNKKNPPLSRRVGREAGGKAKLIRKRLQILPNHLRMRLIMALAQGRPCIA
jgi:hypothetical protein